MLGGDTLNRHENISGIGKVKWFGGVTRTGRENDFGFITTHAGDLYFQRSDSLCTAEDLTEGAAVVFNVIEGKKGKAAKAVRLLAQLGDEAIASIVNCSPSLPSGDVVTAASFMESIDSCEEAVFQALTALATSQPSPSSVAKFWNKFVPSGPKDQFLAIAPSFVKARYYEKHFAVFRHSLRDLFSSVESATTTMSCIDAYSGLDARDELIAQEWIGKLDYGDAVAKAMKAKMLSARAAEKVTKRFYEGLGANVEDVSICQLKHQAEDWKTHDLLVDSTVPVDVKNARRPVSGTKFYVEHTIPKFKLVRRNVDVRIAGVLSPYLNYENIKNPGGIGFKAEDLVFLGETSRKKIDRLVYAFGSSGFEVVRAYEKTVPNWVFAYPEAWYRTFLEDVRRFVEDCQWPEAGEWEYVLGDSEKMPAIPALCISGMPLPEVVATNLSRWQVEFYSKLQSLVGNFPEMPVIFFAVLTDFLGQLKDDDSNFTPEGYWPLLYSKRKQRYVGSFESEVPSYPLGAIDPLGLVAGLIETLLTLWQGRKNTDLKRFSNFRFTGLGILQGRERDRRDWTTIIAYCGGTAYRTNNEGKVLLNPDGKPVGEKGKCGNVPLIIGDSETCPACGKLVCNKCNFCCQACQERQFAEQAEEERQLREEYKSAAARTRREYSGGSDPRWAEIPLEAYEDDFRRS